MSEVTLRDLVEIREAVQILSDCTGDLRGAIIALRYASMKPNDQQAYDPIIASLRTLDDRLNAVRNLARSDVQRALEAVARR